MPARERPGFRQRPHMSSDNQENVKVVVVLLNRERSVVLGRIELKSGGGQGRQNDAHTQATTLRVWSKGEGYALLITEPPSLCKE